MKSAGPAVRPGNLLASFLAGRSLGYSAFARLVMDRTPGLNADRSRIQRAATDQRRPGRDLALGIETASDGAVPAAYWRTRGLRGDPEQIPPASRRSRRGAKQTSREREANGLHARDSARSSRSATGPGTPAARP